MKLIIAIIRPEKLADVKRALFQVGVTGMTLSRDTGHGGERDEDQQYRGDTVVLEFHEKVRIEMACSDPFVERTIEAICDAARTGDVGDGKIFIMPLDHTVRIRTGERDNDALTAVNADEVMRMTQLEMQLLTYFIENAGRVIPRGELLEQVWDLPPTLNTRAPDQFLRRLR